jgi:hypothetical protein
METMVTTQVSTLGVRRESADETTVNFKTDIK